MRWLLACALLFAACHPSTRKTLEPEVPQGGSPAARSKFADAKAKFLQDGHGMEEFAKIARDFPEDPIAPLAELYEGRAGIKAHQYDVAVKALEHVIKISSDDKTTFRAKLFLGIAYNYAGDTAHARELLQKSGGATEDDDERTEYLAAFAYAFSGTDPSLSIVKFDELYPRVTRTEQAAIIDKIDTMVAAIDLEAAKKLYQEVQGEHDTPGLAIVASRLAQNGDVQARGVADKARAAVGLPKLGIVVQPPKGPSGILGAILPIGVKKAARSTDATLVSLGLVAGAAGGTGVTAIEVRAGADATASSSAVDELAKANVVAIVGPVDDDAVAAASEKAEALGIPLLSLAPRPEDHPTSKFVFHVRHSPIARGKILARQALARGVTKIYVMAVDSKYGEAVSKAFAEEIAAGGGSIAGKVTYASDKKSFEDKASKLSGDFQGVFVADNAERLELIVPALANAGFIPKPIGTKKVVGGRPILLLSTAEGLGAGYVANAGRYSEGALLAPGYYPDSQDPTSKAFVDKYVAAFGRAPGAVEAYAYDAAQLAAAASTGTRDAARQSLAAAQLVGVTGNIKFDADHLRADPGVLYTVVDDNGSYSIRVSR